MGSLRGGSVWALAIRLAGGGRVWFDVADVARSVSVVAGLGGTACLARRAHVSGVALTWGLCLCVLVSRALGGVFCPLNVAALAGWDGVAPSAWLILLLWVSAFLPVLVPFPVSGVVVPSPSHPWC